MASNLNKYVIQSLNSLSKSLVPRKEKSVSKNLKGLFKLFEKYDVFNFTIQKFFYEETIKDLLKYNKKTIEKRLKIEHNFDKKTIKNFWLFYQMKNYKNFILEKEQKFSNLIYRLDNNKKIENRFVKCESKNDLDWISKQNSVFLLSSISPKIRVERLFHFLNKFVFPNCVLGVEIISKNDPKQIIDLDKNQNFPQLKYFEKNKKFFLRKIYSGFHKWPPKTNSKTFDCKIEKYWAERPFNIFKEFSNISKKTTHYQYYLKKYEKKFYIEQENDQSKIAKHPFKKSKKSKKNFDPIINRNDFFFKVYSKNLPKTKKINIPGEGEFYAFATKHKEALIQIKIYQKDDKFFFEKATEKYLKIAEENPNRLPGWELKETFYSNLMKDEKKIDETEDEKAEKALIFIDPSKTDEITNLNERQNFDFFVDYNITKIQKMEPILKFDFSNFSQKIKNEEKEIILNKFQNKFNKIAKNISMEKNSIFIEFLDFKTARENFNENLRWKFD